LFFHEFISNYFFQSLIAILSCLIFFLNSARIIYISTPRGLGWPLSVTTRTINYYQSDSALATPALFAYFLAQKSRSAQAEIGVRSKAYFLFKKIKAGH